MLVGQGKLHLQYEMSRCIKKRLGTAQHAKLHSSSSLQAGLSVRHTALAAPVTLIKNQATSHPNRLSLGKTRMMQ